MYLSTAVGGYRLGDLELGARTPESMSEVKEADCPVCLSTFTRPRDWVVFRCSHALCSKCLWKLLVTADVVAGKPCTCPICRQALLTPAPGAVPVPPQPSAAPCPGTEGAAAAAASSRGGVGSAQWEGPPTPPLPDERDAR